MAGVSERCNSWFVRLPSRVHWLRVDLDRARRGRVTALADLTSILVARVLAAAELEEEWIELLRAECDIRRPLLVS